tara:strand:- start:700 stop:1047 length:348 start_codon:yes stop_codon:yes gene_type:complete
MGNPVIDEYGDKWWCDSDGKLHRVAGPAVEWSNGTKVWYQHGTVHRSDGPTVVYADGHRDWYQHGKLHRTDGPAREWADGDKSWYLHGKNLSFDKWLDQVDFSDEAKVMMKLKYG